MYSTSRSSSSISRISSSKNNSIGRSITAAVAVVASAAAAVAVALAAAVAVVTMTLFCTHGRVSGPSSLLDLEVMAPRGYSVPCQF